MLAEAAAERATDEGGHDQPQRRDAALGEEHRRERGDQQQLDDAGLGQRDVANGWSRGGPRVRLPMTRCAAPERSRCPLVRCGRGGSRSRTGCPWAVASLPLPHGRPRAGLDATRVTLRG